MIKHIVRLKLRLFSYLKPFLTVQVSLKKKKHVNHYFTDIYNIVMC